MLLLLRIIMCVIMCVSDSKRIERFGELAARHGFCPCSLKIDAGQEVAGDRE
jgi:hypothetical protein